MMSVFSKNVPERQLFRCHEPLVSPKCSFSYSKLKKTYKVNSYGFQSVDSKALFRQCDKCNFGSFSPVWQYFHKKKCIFNETININQIKKLNDLLPQDLLHCDQCNFKTSHKTHLKAHLAVKHISCELQKSSQCAFKNNLSQRLKNNQEQNNEPVKLQELSFKHYCNQRDCMYKTDYKHNLRLHQMLKHSSKSFSIPNVDDSIIKTHASSELPNWFHCGECDFKTVDYGYLRSHVNRKHVKLIKLQQSFQCAHCEYTTSRKSVLHNHIRIKHPPIESSPNFKCDHCKTIFTKSHKSVHSFNQPPKIFACHYCDFMSVRENILRTHIRKVHSQGTFFCSKCNFKSFNRAQSIAHQKIHGYFEKNKLDLSDQYKF